MKFDQDQLIERLTRLRHKTLPLYPHFSARDFNEITLRKKDVNGQLVHFCDGGRIPHNLLDKQFLDLLTYQVNSDGIHWHENVERPEIVTLGCSLTAGQGLPWNFTWPAIIEHVSGRSINNIARAGHNVWGQVDRAIHHFAQYGPPKEVHLLSPPLSRALLIRHPDGIQNISYNDNLGSYTDFDFIKQESIPYIHFNADNSKSLLSVDFVVDRNLSAFDLLAGVCRIIGAELKVFSWDNNSQHLFGNIGYPELQQWPQHLLEKGESHLPPEKHLKWSYPHPVGWMGADGCCDLEPQSEWQELCWELALDRPVAQGTTSHPGLHSQIHFAEVMSGLRITNEMIKEIRPWYEGTALEPVRN